MTYPPAPGAYPAYNAPQQPAHFRGRRPIQIGSILMAAGLALVIIGSILAATNALSKVNDFQRVAVADRTGTVHFDKAGGYVAYYESNEVTGSTSQTVPEIPVMLTPQGGGAPLNLTTPYGNRSDGKIKFLHYDYNGHKGLALWQFHIDQPGTYNVTLTPNPAAASDATIAFGTSIAGGVVLGGTFVLIGALLLVAGLITLIVGLVKRRRHRREVRSGGGGYGYGGPSGWQQPAAQQPWPPQQQQGWPQQGGSQQGWPQQGGSQQGWPQQGGSQQAWPQQGGQPGWPQSEGEQKSW